MATILGLLLVVTFIANYLSTTLPNTMNQNDLQHELAVENQVALLSARVESIAEANAVGAQVTQPITFGSAGAPPFAGPDSSTLGALPNGSSLSVSFALVGPLVLPTGGTPNFGTPGSKCTPTLPFPYKAIVCTGSTSMNWNFSSGSGVSYWVNGTGGLSAQVNFTTNNSVISVGQVGGANNIVGVFGNHNTVTVTAKGGSNVVFLMVGSNNTVSITANGGATFTILVVGNYDSVSTSANGGSSIVATYYGGHDSYTDTSSSTVYFTGFNVQNANAGLCPYANVANTDTVGGTGGGTAYFNNTNASNTNHTTGGWAYRYANPSPSACPFVVTQVIPQSPSGAGFVVTLHNTYAPSAEVAYDQGAVVFAEPGGVPIFVIPPPISFARGVLQVFAPQFTNRVPTEGGVATADTRMNLLAAPEFAFPGNGFSLGTNGQVTIQIVTPYAAAWFGYFLSVASLAPYVSCTGANSVCTGLYEPGGPLGTVLLVVPTSQGTVLDFASGVYSFGLG